MPDLKVEWKEKAKVLQILVILFKKISNSDSITFLWKKITVVVISDRASI